MYVKDIRTNVVERNFFVYNDDDAAAATKKGFNSTNQSSYRKT